MTPTSAVVLLIEAQDEVRHALAEYLRECGYRVIEAKDGNQAKAILKRSQPKVQVALVDGGTTGSGYALRNWIMSRHPSVEVMLAGSTDNTVRGAGEVCKDASAIQKPYDHGRVLDRIRHSIARRTLELTRLSDPPDVTLAADAHYSPPQADAPMLDKRHPRRQQTR